MQDTTANYELDPFAEAVGRVANGSALLEELLAGVYEDLLDTELAWVAARGQSFDVLATAVAAVAGALPDHPRQLELTAAIGRARELYRDRNVVIHSVLFGVAGFENERESMRYRRWRSEPDMRRWTLEEVRRLADELVNHAWHLHEFREGWRRER